MIYLQPPPDSGKFHAPEIGLIIPPTPGVDTQHHSNIFWIIFWQYTVKPGMRRFLLGCLNYFPVYHFIVKYWNVTCDEGTPVMLDHYASVPSSQGSLYMLYIPWEYDRTTWPVSLFPASVTGSCRIPEIKSTHANH